jgi:N-acetylglucosamine kinase-like BadF-type ATPase
VAGRTCEADDAGPVPRASGRIDAAALGARIGGLVAHLQPRLQPGLRARRVAVGLTGMPGLLESPAELAAHLLGHVASRSLILAGDCLTTHLGALEGRPGAVVAAGTGVIALGTDHRTTWQRADGWGHLLGDEGSGAWIGAQGLRAALREGDGRDGGSKLLRREVEVRFGDPDDALRAIYGSPAPGHELAAFAPAVAAAAHEGDRVAADIWRRAAGHLAEAVHATATGLGAKDGAELSWGGGLFDAGPLLLDPFRTELTRRLPGARLTPPAGRAADGALLLARRGLPPDGPDRAAAAPYAVEFGA